MGNRFAALGMQTLTPSDGSPHPVMVASIKYHTAMEAFVFEQRFPNGITGAATGTDAEPWSCFPSLHTSSHKMSELGYLTQVGRALLQSYHAVLTSSSIICSEVGSMVLDLLAILETSKAAAH